MTQNKQYINKDATKRNNSAMYESLCWVHFILYSCPYLPRQNFARPRNWNCES